MRSLLIHSTKFDGSLHYRYTATIVHETPEVVMVYTSPGQSYDSYRGGGETKNHSLQLYWPSRYYNVHVNWFADWRNRTHYVNIATPATWDQDALRYVDLDLDVIWGAVTGEVILDDEDEFVLHQARFGYPSSLIERVWQSQGEVRDLIAQRLYPFDGSLYAWRPNGAA